MRFLFLSILFAFFVLNISGQVQHFSEQGTISYITSQSVYVKFESTKNIAAGDTLYFKKENNLIPVLEVRNTSSISCVCTPISSHEFNVSDVVVTQAKPVNIPIETVIVVQKDTISPLKEEDAVNVTVEKTEQKERIETK